MLSGISGLTGRPLAWLRRHRRLGVALLSALVLIGVVPLLAYAVTFSKPTTFIGAVTLTVPLAVASGGTAASTAAGARTNLGLGTMATQNTGTTGGLGGQSGNVWQTGTVDPANICIGSTGESWTNGIFTGPVAGTLDCDGDLAEYFPTTGEKPQRGDIVSLSSTTTSLTFHVANPNTNIGESASTTYTMTLSNIKIAAAGERDLIVGAVPTSPGVILGNRDPYSPDSNAQLLAISGHVPIRMTLDGGDIAIGDPITVSLSTPGAGMKATTTGKIIGFALAPFSANNAPGDGMIEVTMQVQNWTAPQDFNALLELSQLNAASTNSTPFTTRFFSSLFTRLTEWFADATNGIRDFYASIVHSDRVETKELCVGSTCVTEDQFKAMVARSAAAGAPSAGSGAPDSDSALGGLHDAEPRMITINGDNPATSSPEILVPAIDLAPAANDKPPQPSQCYRFPEGAILILLQRLRLLCAVCRISAAEPLLPTSNVLSSPELLCAACTNLLCPSSLRICTAAASLLRGARV
jgi:hypothetical protein